MGPLSSQECACGAEDVSVPQRRVSRRVDEGEVSRRKGRRGVERGARGWKGGAGSRPVRFPSPWCSPPVPLARSLAGPRSRRAAECTGRGREDGMGGWVGGMARRGEGMGDRPAKGKRKTGSGERSFFPGRNVGWVNCAARRGPRWAVFEIGPATGGFRPGGKPSTITTDRVLCVSTTSLRPCARPLSSCLGSRARSRWPASVCKAPKTSLQRLYTALKASSIIHEPVGNHVRLCPRALCLTSSTPYLRS